MPLNLEIRTKTLKTVSVHPFQKWSPETTDRSF